MKDLQNLEFDAHRYIIEPWSVIQDAILKFPYIKQSDVKAYLDGRLRKELYDSIKWDEPILIFDITLLLITYQGERYQSYVDVTHRELIVSMIVNEAPLTSKTVLHEGSTYTFVKETVDGKLISEYGLQVAKNMVVELLIRNYRNLA